MKWREEAQKAVGEINAACASPEPASQVTIEQFNQAIWRLQRLVETMQEATMEGVTV